MAKKKAASDLNKSKAIREYSAENPSAKPKAIAEALTAQYGVPFTNAQVSTVLFNARKKRGKKRGRRGPGRPAGVRTGANTTEAAVTLIRQAGGFSEARAALNELEKLAKLLK